MKRLDGWREPYKPGDLYQGLLILSVRPYTGRYTQWFGRSVLLAFPSGAKLWCAVR